MNERLTAILGVTKNQDDFGFELRVGKTIRSVACLSSNHGGTYSDDITGKPRQFDYRCHLRKENEVLSLAVECKNISEKAPLVICGIRRPKNESFHSVIDSAQGTRQLPGGTIVGLSAVAKRHIYSTKGFYSEGEFVGKSSFKVKLNDVPKLESDNDIYEKWAQAISSSVEVANHACERSKSLGCTRIYSAVLPVLVIPDRTLIQIQYDENGEVIGEPKYSDHVEYFVAREIKISTRVFQGPKFVISHVHFFSLSGFSSFLARMAVNGNAWNALFGPKNDDSESNLGEVPNNKG